MQPDILRAMDETKKDAHIEAKLRTTPRKLRDVLANATRKSKVAKRGTVRRARKCIQAAFSTPRGRGLGRYRAAKRLRLPEER